MASRRIGLPGIKIQCLLHGIKQNELARRLGVTTNHLSGVANGTRNASIELAVDSAAIFGCTVDDLLRNPQAGGRDYG